MMDTMAWGNAAKAGASVYAMLLATISLGACGSETSAAVGAERSESADAETAEKRGEATMGGTTASALPIEHGIYTDTESGDCSASKSAFFYDGVNYGYITPAEPGWQDEAYFESNRIVRVAAASRNSDYYEYYRGHTLVWHEGNANDEEYVLGIKAGIDGTFSYIEAGSGPKGDMTSYGEYQMCAFAKLSPRLQAEIRAKMPKLVGGTTPAAAKASIAFPPIPQGFYAYGSTCAEAIASGAGGDPPIGLVLFTSKGIGEWDGTMQISGFEDIGKDRFKVKGRSYGNGDDPVGEQSDFTIRVTGPSSFFDERMQEELTHCPNVPANVREQYM